jgi:hypothetical protein
MRPAKDDNRDRGRQQPDWQYGLDVANRSAVGIGGETTPTWQIQKTARSSGIEGAIIIYDVLFSVLSSFPSRDALQGCRLGVATQGILLPAGPTTHRPRPPGSPQRCDVIGSAGVAPARAGETVAPPKEDSSLFAAAKSAPVPGRIHKADLVGSAWCRVPSPLLRRLIQSGRDVS